jgi:hypothetical protein
LGMNAGSMSRSNNDERLPLLATSLKVNNTLRLQSPASTYRTSYARFDSIRVLDWYIKLSKYLQL